LNSDDIKREFDRDRLIALAKAEGLGAKWGRIECPERCSSDPRGASVGDNGLYQCKRCSKGGSAIDLVMAVRRLDFAQAVEQLGSSMPPRPAPRQKRSRDPKALWEGFATIDPAGLAYLKLRGLGDAAEKGLVRFSTGKSGDAWLDARAAEGFRIAMPLYGAEGALCSFQLRTIIQGHEPSKLALAGCPYPKTGAFFRPGLGSSALHLAEGMADTLALSLGGAFVVGFPGQDQLLKAAALYPTASWAGTTVVLCPQNDSPRKKPHEKTSRERFEELAKVLLAFQANVVWHETPERHKDPADHLRAQRAEFAASLVPPAATIVPRGTPAGPPQLSVVGSGPEPVALPHDAARPLSSSYASICQILRTPVLRAKVLGPGALEFNELTLMPTLDREPVTPTLVSRLREKCEHEFEDRKRRPLEFARSDIEQALVAVAHEKSFHPVADWLSSLKWDGIHRIEKLADDILEIQAPTPLERVMLRKWMISAVARALEPGCQVDTVLVLVGAQGKLKSSFFRALAGEYFSDASMALEQKDAMLVMHRAWVIEWAELEAMQRARDQGTVKAFVTRRSDDFRPPYGREVEAHPRRCVIVGTTNNRDFLSDPSGARRYWPIEAPSRINLAGLAAQRDQLWAEAVSIHQAAQACAACRPLLPADRCSEHSWYLTALDEKSLRGVHEKYEEVDPWEEQIVAFLEKPGTMQRVVTTPLLLEEALLMRAKETSRAEAMRVAAIMTGLRWEQTRYSLKGQRIREWVRPTAQPALPLPDQNRERSGS
jgi:hypothetical protein